MTNNYSTFMISGRGLAYTNKFGIISSFRKMKNDFSSAQETPTVRVCEVKHSFHLVTNSKNSKFK